jgi:hypothetical protein
VSGAETVLVVTLAANGALVFGYRIYRLARGGPLADAVGGAVLAVLLAVIAIGVAADVEWVRYVALAYGLLFGLAVMPIWVLGVLIPMRPGIVDYSFTVLYWSSLGVIVVAALAA